MILMKEAGNIVIAVDYPLDWLFIRFPKQYNYGNIDKLNTKHN